jgi:hypothetical protein
MTAGNALDVWYDEHEEFKLRSRFTIERGTIRYADVEHDDKSTN